MTLWLGLPVVLSLLIAAGCRTVAPTVPALPATIAPVHLRQAPRTDKEQGLPLVVWTERRDKPEPLAIHVLRIDLQCPTLEVIAMPANDPDGDGPAQAFLNDPLELAHQYEALAAVNANAFMPVPDAAGKTDHRWRPGQPVQIEGVTMHAGMLRSGPSKTAANNLCFWLDTAQRPNFGPWPGDAAHMREAVNAFWGNLVEGGRVLPRLGGDRHPRTALGVDASGRWLYLVVVDGRQPDYSVGMTTHELATLMAELGCGRAINLDGGGSSILLAVDGAGALEIVNRPSGGVPRPVPVLIGVRCRATVPGAVGSPKG